MRADYGDILGDIEVEEAPGSFMPVLTPEMSNWLFQASVSLGCALGGGCICKRTYRIIQQVTNAVALFTPNDIVLPDGRQRATFSTREMAKAIGLGSDSTRVVQQALRVLCLTTTSKDAATYRKAYELLYEERGGKPLLVPLYKSKSRKLASAWGLCDIRPRTVSSSKVPGDSHKLTYPTVPQKNLSVVARGETVASSTATVVDCAAIISTTVSDGYPNRNDYSSVRIGGSEIYRHPTHDETATDSVELGGLASTTLNANPLILSSSEGAEDWYSKLSRLFQRQPGKMETETRGAFYRLVDMGYAPRALYDGAAAYVAKTPKSEQMRFPLKFLEDVALVRSWCKTSPRALDLAKLSKQEGYWTYPFATGLEYVACPPSATKDEAFEAVRRMVAEGGRRP